MINKLLLIFCTLFVLILGMQSCKQNPQIEEKKFVKIYSEMIFMQDTSSLSKPTIKEKVLKKFNVSENDYNNTVKYFNEEPEKWQNFFDSVIVYIERRRPKSNMSDVKSLPEQSVSVDK